MAEDDTSRLERRTVEVDDPGLSAATNRRLTDEVRDVIGSDTVLVPADRPRPSRGDRPSGSPLLSFASSNWLMIMIAAFAALVIGGILAATTGSWWFVALAIVVDIIGLAVTAIVVLRMTAIVERPDPTVAAAMEEEGVTSPERHFTQIVGEFTEADDEIGDAESRHRRTPVEDDPARAGAEQRTATTPSGGSSRAVGPGD